LRNTFYTAEKKGLVVAGHERAKKKGEKRAREMGLDSLSFSGKM